MTDHSKTDPLPFDITDPLPSGTTLLEASAGTGKTWTIGALVTRYVAEGVAELDEMLVVTFGRMASQELRERVREHLVSAEHVLATSFGEPGDRAATPGEPDPLTRLLLDADPAQRRARRYRLRAALASFDTATIATTHQFCQLVLRSLGTAGDTDAGAHLVEDLGDLLEEVVDDLYVRGFAGSTEPPTFTRGQARQLAYEAAVADPTAVLEPADADPKSPAGRRVGFARAVRAELERRKRLLGVLSYDDLLIQVAQALAPEDAPARHRMRSRWRVVLVDEFQDTDPVQWQVLDRAFTGHATMVLIGDPKQAIYAFRGGDVVTYLEASRTATTRRTLGRNWRTDAPLLAAQQRMLLGAALGDPEIVVRDVEAVHQHSRLTGAHVDAPLRLRVHRRDQFGEPPGKLVGVTPLRPALARDVAHDIHALLTSGARFDDRPLRPSDVAVLSFQNARLWEVQAALADVGIPAVLGGNGSVFATPAATDWLTLLESLEQPHRSPRVRAAALSPFVGRTAAELADGGDRLTDTVAELMRSWAESFERRGVAAVLEAAGSRGLTARVLANVGGERHLTDLRQVGQLLHAAAVTDRLGMVALVGWLREQMADDRPEAPGARTRRLDSDAAAVQLVTIHGSKGLQYPIVYLPHVADRWVGDRADIIPLFHGPAPASARSLDIGGNHPDRRANLARSQAEDAGESLRLLYVAMTRAQSQVVTWWSPTSNTPKSALHRMLFGRRPGQDEVPDHSGVPSDDEAAKRLGLWQSEGALVVEPAEPGPLTGEPPAAPAPELSARRFDRTVDTTWRRTSYSALSAAARTGPPDAVGSEPEETTKQDEPPIEIPAAISSEGPTAEIPSPMADLPAGAAFGSLVHAVLEVTDPRSSDLHAAFVESIREQLVRWPSPVDVGLLAEALVQVCDTPLGHLARGATLREVPMTDRLCEMDFELPLAGGDRRDQPAGSVTLGELAPLLRRHLDADDPLLPYARVLDQDPELAGQRLSGYLTGSIDVALRVDGRYLVVDYKTNWLGRPDHRLSAHDYRPEALVDAMGHSDYPLQALLYAVVLHRFLRWRLGGGYSPEAQLGGVLYLYLRGMCGAETPIIDGAPCGVFSWRPPLALVEELSDLLDGAAADSAGAA
ncbi:UvrD-helicase domain-containing protein [Occultella aeris]|uniref:RecBCD enzyme subunit RecB n=1 Tax=Occultella aeris TaxID=2761496 RepID=A0A7M4DE65_9MICO|nr:UvrD-helicase domain-containing protein [Occultella aeris]VZO35179.1 RecBCD enzyme subunit RecB [Occultella aeris]